MPSAAKVTPARKTLEKTKNTKGYKIIDEESGNAKAHFTGQNFLFSVVQSAGNRSIGYSLTNNYGRTFPLSTIYHMRTEIEEVALDLDYEDKACRWRELLAEAEKFWNSREKHSHERFKSGKVEFTDVIYLLKEGTPVEFKISGEPAGGIIDKVTLQYGFFGNKFLQIDIKVFHAIKGFIRQGTLTTYLGEWDGLTGVSELNIQPLTEKTRAALIERGKSFIKFTSGGAKYVSYTGQLVQSSWWSNASYRADGRVMLDCATFQQVEQNQYRDETRAAKFKDDDDDDEAAPNESVKVPEGEEWRCYPFVYGFSFSAKRWGRMAVATMRDIDWRTDSFEKLVLDPEDKELVRALVEHHGTGFSDIIEGKGGGTIFLLHGPPGEGKTLTAEATAEVLGKPLYSVSVGELGTNPDQLEERLRVVLDIATIWDAVILLDEADIFLEARDEHNIIRNAMVGVFLRLLEYHQGVLFLTTNRVKNIDPAFFSRITLAIHFVKGEAAKRKKVWDNLLAAAKITGMDTKTLSDFEINGRQIKSIIRTAMTLAKAGNGVVTEDLIRTVVNRVTKFQREISSV